jgi:putative transposase
LTRARHQVVNRTPAHIEQAVIGIRRRLATHSTPQTRYSLIGAPQIRAELEALGYTPLPGVRTIEHIISRAGLSCPPLRLTPRITRNPYPAPQAQDSNDLHQVDLVGPRYLTGDSTRYYFLICKDVYDRAVYMEFARSRKMDTILDFVVHAWQQLGLPQHVQFDNGREFCGFGTSARFLTRLIRLCLRVGVEVVFIPPSKPQHNGSVENFNGWFQPLLLNRPFRRPAEVRRELRRLVTTVNEQHVHAHLGGKTVAQYRQGKQLRKLPANFMLDYAHLPIATGKVTFIRLVSAQGAISLLGQSFKLGKRLKFRYVKATLYTKLQRLKVYHKGKLVKEFPYALSKN